jgi:hypothetical protein
MRLALPGGKNAAGEETILQELGDGLILRSPKNSTFLKCAVSDTAAKNSNVETETFFNR